MPHPDRAAGRTVAAAAVADAVCIAAFCALGRRSHAEGLTVAGVAETAWPFLSGAAIGWIAARGWRRPLALVPTGVTVWVATVVVGMLLRKATGAGTATSFIVVATITTAVLLLGWRGGVALRARRSGERLDL
jgi:peptidoglycan/LPS O-acetylase OafA/YrhL